MSLSPIVETAPDYKETFTCPEESTGYASALYCLLFSKLDGQGEGTTIVEFGSGNGDPVITAIKSSGFRGIVHGYEINKSAATEANRLIAEQGISKNYVVYHSSFHTSQIPEASYLIANPPYIPCDISDHGSLILPGLSGGKYGNDISTSLLSLHYPNVLLEISSYADPIATVLHAKRKGYKIADFLIKPLPFGPYSCQPIVWERLIGMQHKDIRKAFFTEQGYLVGSALFTLDDEGRDISDTFLTCLTACNRPCGPHPPHG